MCDGSHATLCGGVGLDVRPRKGEVSASQQSVGNSAQKRDGRADKENSASCDPEGASRHGAHSNSVQESKQKACTAESARKSRRGRRDPQRTLRPFSAASAVKLFVADLVECSGPYLRTFYP